MDILHWNSLLDGMLLVVSVGTGSKAGGEGVEMSGMRNDGFTTTTSASTTTIPTTTTTITTNTPTTTTTTTTTSK